jgi:hypothetical protein
MNKLSYFVAVILLCVSAIATFAQATDPDLDTLTKIVGIIQKVNAIPVDFARASAELAPAGTANVQKQAALLKQLPPGTTVEIGVHTFRVGDETKNVQLTQTRADNIRTLLITSGVQAANLIARGYGSSKLLVGNSEDPKNRRVEYLVTKSGKAASAPPLKPVVNDVSSRSPAIIAGQGWGRVEIGAFRSQVEFILGYPDYFGVDSRNPEDSYATYFQKGVVVIYKSKELTVKLIRFIGNASLYSDGKSKFSSFQGKPDKGLKWNSTSAQVIAAYGAPTKREAHEDYPTKIEILNLFYSGINFLLKGDQLFQINIEPGGSSTSNPQPVSTPITQPAVSPKKVVDNKSGEELFEAVVKNQMDEAREMIKRGVGLNFERKDETTLIVAIRYRRVEMARMLLEAGADPEFAESQYGGTPLRWAVQMTDIDTLKLLIDKYKVNVNQPSKNKISPLHTAADFGQDDRVTKILLDAGANANVLNDEGQSPLDNANRWKKTTIIPLLERATNAGEIAKQKIAWALLPITPKPVPTPAVVVAPPKPTKIYGPDEDDPNEVDSMVRNAKSAAIKTGYKLLDEGNAVRQAGASNDENQGVKQYVTKGMNYQFVMISKDALTVNAVMNGTLLAIPCNSCRTSISTYSTSLLKSPLSNGYYLISLQMQIENFQANYVSFILKGNKRGEGIKYLLFTKPN